MNRNRIWRLHMQSTGNSLEKALLFVCLVCLSLFECMDIVQGAEKRMQNIPSDVQVIFIPGWQSEDKVYNDVIQELTTIFQGKRVCPTPWHWKSDQYWPDAIVAADAEAKKQAILISNLPAQQRQELVLIGHSLGGRIAIRTMAILNEKKIKHGIFLAAAISDDDPDIELAMKASTFVNLNFYCRDDAALYRSFRDFGDGSKCAQGAFGYCKPYTMSMLQEFSLQQFDETSTLKDFEKHRVQNYVKELKHVMKDETCLKGNFGKTYIPESAKISYILNQVTYLNARCDACGMRSGELLDSCHFWELRKQREYIILDPKHNLRAHGTEKEMRAAFQKIKDALAKYEPSKMERNEK